MNQTASYADPDAIFNEVALLPVTRDGSDALMAFPPSGGVPEVLSKCPATQRAIREIAAIRRLTPLHVMVNTLPARVRVPVHRDFLAPSPLQGRHPRLERWHLPIKTATRGSWWWDELWGGRLLTTGFWWGPMPYWKKHYVENLSDEDRVHLIVDLDAPVPLGDYDA